MKRLIGSNSFRYQTFNDDEDYDSNMIQLVGSNNEIIGTLIYSYREDKNEIRLEGIGVTSEFRGIGIGRKLMQEFANKIQQYYNSGDGPKITAMQNVQAQMFYEKINNEQILPKPIQAI